jgi:hypothetical protein
MEAHNDDRIAVPWPTVIMGDEHQSLTLSQLPILTADKMKYVNLGKSGLKVSQIILGCMSYGVKRPADKWTWVLEEEEAMKHLKVSFCPLVHGLKLTMQHAYDAGINVSSSRHDCLTRKS